MVGGRRVTHQFNTLGIVPRSQVQNIEETGCRSTICSDIITERPLLVTVVFRLSIVWLVSIILGERVADAFAGDFVSVPWSVWSLSARNRVREVEIIEKA